MQFDLMIQTILYLGHKSLYYILPNFIHSFIIIIIIIIIVVVVVVVVVVIIIIIMVTELSGV